MSVPAEGSMMHTIMKGAPDEQKKAMTRFRFWNRYFVIPLLRINVLQLFGFGFIFVLLRTTGRKSGKTRNTPLEYLKKDGKLLLYSSRGAKSDWYRNLMAHPQDVRVKYHFRMRQPIVRDVSEVEERIELIRYYIETRRSGGKTLFGWREEMGMEAEVFVEVATYLRIVELTV